MMQSSSSICAAVLSRTPASLQRLGMRSPDPLPLIPASTFSPPDPSFLLLLVDKVLFLFSCTRFRNCISDHITALTMMRHLMKHILPRVWGTGAKRSSVLLSLASVYLWDEDGVNRQDLQHTVREFWRMYRENGASNFAGEASAKRMRPNDGSPGDEGPDEGSPAIGLEEDGTDDDACAEDWEAIILKDEFQVYRRLVPGSTYLYQYKIFGSYSDIPAKAFFLVQLDTTFRKVWDKLVLKLEVVEAEDKLMKRNPDYEALIDEERDFDTKNQVVHWVMHYPYPMYCRQYCYVRRAIIDRKKNLMILVSKSTNHPSCDQTNEYVRVTAYDSRMVIRPHRTLHEDGFDYLLTYSDDPQSSFPSAAYNWMAYSGVPDFVNKLHAAAVRLNKESVGKRKQKDSTRIREIHDYSPTLSHDENRDTNNNPTAEKPDIKREERPEKPLSTKSSPKAGSSTPRVSQPSNTSSIRVDSGHTLFHAWSSFFSR